MPKTSLVSELPDKSTSLKEHGQAKRLTKRPVYLHKCTRYYNFVFRGCKFDQHFLGKFKPTLILHFIVF